MLLCRPVAGADLVVQSAHVPTSTSIGLVRAQRDVAILLADANRGRESAFGLERHDENAQQVARPCERIKLTPHHDLAVASIEVSVYC